MIMRTKHLKEEEVIVEIRKRYAVQNLFGKLKHWKINPQKMKDGLRKEWAK